MFGLRKDLKVLKCRGCRLQNINPQLYNLLNQLTDLDLGNNQVIYFDFVIDLPLKRKKVYQLYHVVSIQSFPQISLNANLFLCLLKESQTSLRFFNFSLVSFSSFLTLPPFFVPIIDEKSRKNNANELDM